MKHSTTRLAIAAAVAVSAALANGVAYAGVITKDTSVAGGSDLVLFVTNASKTSFYVQDLGVQVDALRSKATVASDPVFNPFDSSNGPMNSPAIGGTNSNLASFLTANPGSTWSIMAGDSTGGTQNAGDRRLVVTSTADLPSTGLTDSQIFDAVGNLRDFFAGDVNNATYTNGVSGTSGWGDSTGGKFAPNTFVSASYPNGASIGTAQTLYMFATEGGKSASTAGNSYVSALTIKVLSDGTIQVGTVSAVPLPAALWLFGSGLVGLTGIARRRRILPQPTSA